MPKSHAAFQMPTVMKITGRSSSITNAFVNAIIPVIAPTDEEVEEALSILGIKADDMRCSYCGDLSTEWDHLRPLVVDQKPTGYVSEIANLVPACGKCNQSKGKRHWREWMESTARRSPTSRRLEGIVDRIAALERYEQWRQPVRINFEEVVGGELWAEHWSNWSAIQGLMKTAQKHADLLRAKVADHVANAAERLAESFAEACGETEVAPSRTHHEVMNGARGKRPSPTAGKPLISMLTRCSSTGRSDPFVRCA